MGSLDHYRSQLKREQDRAVKLQRDIADRSANIVRSREKLRRGTSSGIQRTNQRELDRHIGQQARDEKKLADINKKIANLIEQVNRAEQREQNAEAKREEKARKKQERDKAILAQQLATTGSNVNDLFHRVSSIEDTLISQVHDAVVYDPVKREHDVFLSFAGPDEVVAKELYVELVARGFDVWFSPVEGKLGHSLTHQIDRGIAQSQVAVIIVTEAFVNGRYWTELEFGAFVSTRKRIIPVLDGIKREDLTHYSPLLSDFLGLDTKENGIATIAELIADALRTRDSDEISG